MIFAPVKPGLFLIMDEMPKIELQPIGVIRCARKYRYEAPRQGAFDGSDGVIELLPAYGGDAVSDLAGFDRIWVIFCFHLNQGKNWKPKVRPPFPVSGPCRSLFATRSPYRVNPVGLSCVGLAGISGNRLFIRQMDMLDGTPVLDIKPYIPEADAFPDSAAGWRMEVPEAGEMRWEVEYTSRFRAESAFIFRRSGLDLLNFSAIHLANEPFDTSRKRVKFLPESGLWQLGCRTWKIIFRADTEKRKICAEKIQSNYTPEELLPQAADRYGDKDIHREYLSCKIFSKN